MTHTNLDQSETSLGAFPQDITEEKAWRKQLMEGAKLYGKQIKLIANERALPPAIVAAGHADFRAHVVGLWFMGYWPNQIARFVGGVDEAVIMGALRKHFQEAQESLLEQMIARWPKQILTGAEV